MSQRPRKMSISDKDRRDAGPSRQRDARPKADIDHASQEDFESLAHKYTNIRRLSPKKIQRLMTSWDNTYPDISDESDISIDSDEDDPTYDPKGLESVVRDAGRGGMGMDISSSDESGDEEQLSEVDAERDFPHDGGFSDVSEQSDVFSELPEPIRPRGRVRGRRPLSRARRGRGGRPASSSRSRSPVHEGGDSGGDSGDDGWSQDPTPPEMLPFTEVPRLCIPVPTSILGFFQIFFSVEVLRYFCIETNAYARLQREELGGRSAYAWKDCVVGDIAKYIGIVMWMGVIRLPRLQMFWSRNKTWSMDSFRKVMSRDRFACIGKYFHSYNRKAIPRNNDDKLILLRPLINHLKKKCQSVYVPEKNLSLDEGMMKWKGRLNIKVYNPKKPCKYGLKFYFLCESKSGFVLDFEIYHGVSDSLQNLVTRLLGRHLGKGYHVFMDNYYNSIQLTDHLYQQKTHCTGTLRLSRGAPKSLQNQAKRRFRRDEIAWRRNRNTFVICWQDLRLVTFVTNRYDASTSLFQHRRSIRRGGVRRQEVIDLQRPKVVEEYINYMGGVDHFDQLMNYYTFARRTSRWTKKTIFYLLQLALVNSFALYVKYSPQPRKKTLLQFQEEIANSLMYYKPNEWPSMPEEAFERAPNLPDGEWALPMVAPPLRRRATQEETEDPDDPQPGPSSDTRATPARLRGIRLETPSPGPSAASASAAPASATAASDTSDDEGVVVDRLSGTHEVAKFKKRKTCHVCTRNGSRMDTAYFCKQCNIPLCTKATRNCWEKYHSQQKYWVTPPRGTKVGSRVRRQM